MEFRLGSTRLTLEFGFVAVLTLSALLDPQLWGVLGWLAALLHELGHLFCCLMLKHPPKALKLTCFGPALVYGSHLPSFRQELLILLSGSGANLFWAALCFLGRRWIPGLEIFGGFHLLLGMLNLFPARGLDGGKVLALLLERLLPPPWSGRVFNIIQFVFLALFTSFSIIFVCKNRLHWTALVFCCYLWLAALPWAAERTLQ